MRRVLLPLLALAGLALAGPAPGQALYSPPEGDFQVAFPDPPSVQSRPAVRSHDIAARRYVDQQQSRAMVVAVNDYPDGELPAAADAGVYDRMLRNRADGESSRLVSTRAARLSGRPCLEGVILDPGGTQEIVRILMIGSRVWELTYALPDGVDAQGADAAFFDSFKITKAG